MKRKVGLRIGAAAQLLGTNVEAIRRAERRGLIRELTRTRGGKRLVSPAALEELRAILPVAHDLVVASGGKR